MPPIWLHISLGRQYHYITRVLQYRTVRKLNNVRVELKNWHPATSRNMNGSNNSNVGAGDLAMPNPPALI